MVMDYSLFSLLLLIFVHGSKSWDVTISPDHAHIKPGGHVSILCKTDVALTACGFQIGEQGYYDLSRGTSTATVTEREGGNGRVLYTLRYTGTGLDKGQCGITLHQMAADGDSYYVGCRVKAASGGWRYRYSSLVVHAWDTFPLKMSPLHAVVMPGGSVTFLCESERPLRMCRFDLPAYDNSLHFDQGPHSPGTRRYGYHGKSLRHGQCGVTLRHVNDDDSGIVWCGVDTVVTNIAQRAASLTVARAPKKMELYLCKSNYISGEQWAATCIVRDSRPVANITWYLGDKIVRQDAENDVSVDAWCWPWDLRTLTQTLTRNASVEDNGKEVKCVVHHVTLTKPMESKQKLSVQASPQEITAKPVTSSTVATPTARVSTNTSTSSTSATPPPTTTAVPHPPSSTASIPLTSVAAIPIEAECGKRRIGTRISNGEEAAPGEYPWTVGIYRSLNNGSYVLDCSGTLITSQLIVTVSHCFWDEVSSRKNNATYRVILGKLTRAWEVVEDTEQRIDAAEIILHPRYRGRKRNYQHDIAFVRLGARANVTEGVGVACVDWTDRFEATHLMPGVNGTATGWGYTEDEVVSDVLKFVSLPYVDAIQCYDSLSEEIQPLVTVDKFCAGLVGRNVSVCPGDSGGGLVFYEESNDRYYLRGIVSLAFRPTEFTGVCYTQQATGFTYVSAYLRWMLPYRTMHP